MMLIKIKFSELLLPISPRIINSLRSYIKHSIGQVGFLFCFVVVQSLYAVRYYSDMSLIRN